MASEREFALASVAAAISPVLAELGERLRAGGVPCGVEQQLLAHRALVEVEPTRVLTRAALRCVMCRSPEDLAEFDAAFDAAFGAETTPPALPTRPGDLERFGPEGGSARTRQRAADATRRSGVHRRAAVGALGEPDADPLASPAPWSAVELLRDKDFATYTEEDRVLARRQVRLLARALPTRRSARWEAVPGQGQRVDVARTIRAALRCGGDPVTLGWSAPGVTQRRLVFVCDLSGSMAAYARAILTYVHAVAQGGRGVETFGFATTLARITHELRDRDPDRAIERAAARLPSHSGGTRIGAAIGALNRAPGRAVGRGAVVVILSDGWDRGEPELLAREMGRLRRTAHRVLWLDPHAASPGYEPLTRGMREAIPHVDRLLAGDSLRALEDLAAALEGDRAGATSPAPPRRLQ